MTKLSTLTSIFCILSILLLPQVFATVYNVEMTCGTCQKTTGCTGNMCLIFTGDIQNQYCYGNATCTTNVKQTFSLGECTTDLSGATCQSGICASSGASMSMCYGATTCLDGVTFDQTCANGNITISMTGGMLGSSYSNTTVPYDSACPFTKAHGNYSTCTGDSLGATCNCCFSAVFEGMYNVMGSCIPQDSPITQTKSSMNKKYGFQTIFAAVFVLIQVFLLSL